MAAGPLLIATYSCPLETVLGLELLYLVDVLIDEPEACAAAASERSLEPEKHDALVVVHLVHGSKFGGKVLLRYVSHARVDDLAHELLPPEQRVLLELARTDRELTHGSVRCLLLAS